MTAKILLFTAVLLNGMWLGAQVNHQQDLKQLIAAENSFAALAEHTSFRNGFLQNLDSMGVVFNGAAPVNGVSFYTAQPDNNDLLFKWYPAFAAITPGGDAGFTTGPYLLISNKNKDTLFSGKFFSIWRKNKDGVFKVLLDGGVTDTSLQPVVFGKIKPATPTGAGVISTAGAASKPSSFNETEKAFTGMAASDLAAASQKYMADQSYLLRSNFITGTAKNENLETLKTTAITTCNFEKKGSFHAADSTVYFNYGTVKTISRQGKNETGYFIQVWQYSQQGWKIVADVLQLID